MGGEHQDGFAVLEGIFVQFPAVGASVLPEVNHHAPAVFGGFGDIFGKIQKRRLEPCGRVAGDDIIARIFLRQSGAKCAGKAECKDKQRGGFLEDLHCAAHDNMIGESEE